MKYVKIAVLALTLIAASLPEMASAFGHRHRCGGCCGSSCSACSSGGCTSGGCCAK
jgi:hypothetical protein